MSREDYPIITPAEAQEMMEEFDTIVIDVREPHEVAASGKVKGAHEIPLGALAVFADPHSPARDPAFTPDKTYIVYCASGNRSTLAAERLKDMGYPKVHNLGAFKTWAAAGGETE